MNWPIGTAWRQWWGPVFLVLALAGPNAIYLSDLMAQRSLGDADSFPAVYDSLVVAGLNLLLIGAGLYCYRWTLARRVVHIVLLFILLDVFYRIAYGGPVTPGLLQAVQQTSQQETLELLAGHPALTVSLSLVALGALVALGTAWRSRIQVSSTACLVTAAAGLCLLVVSVTTATTSTRPRAGCCARAIERAGGAFPVDVAWSLGSVAVDGYRSRRAAATRSAFTFSNVRMRQAASRRETREVYVIVVGETSRRQNWSLFGYRRRTNPELEALAADLVRYRALSNATNTVLSLPMALTRATPETRDRIHSEKSIVTLLRQAGFETFWLSNQERPGLPSNPIYQIAAEAQHVSFHGEATAASGADPFDTNLLGQLDAAVSALPANGKAVIFLHMEGSHFSYKERYPPQFERFVSTSDLPASLSDPQRRLINQYDNSVAFTDHVLAGVLSRLTACDCQAAMLFFSDHGERLFDNGAGDSDFGHGFPEIARQEIEIPLLAWFSPAYRREYPGPVRQIMANSRRTAELHGLFETIVDLVGVDYDGRDAASSLFSDRWQAPSAVNVLSMNDRTITFPVGDGS